MSASSITRCSEEVTSLVYVWTLTRHLGLALALELPALLLLDLLVDLGTSRWLVTVGTSSVGGLLLLLGLLGLCLLLGFLAGLGELVLDRLPVLGVKGLVGLGDTLLVVLSFIVVVHADIGVGARGVALVAVVAVVW